MSWPTFWVDPTGLCRITLRRFVSSDEGDRAKCAGWRGYHDASLLLPATYKVHKDENGYLQDIDNFWAWLPVGSELICDCGYQFEPSDPCQVNQHELYRRMGSNEQWSQDELPPGALFDGWWLRHEGIGPDGISLVCVLPHDGDARSSFWHVDGPARSNGHDTGGRWTRTGTVQAVTPTVHVDPSINSNLEESPNHYHGWLHYGVLSDPI